MVVTENFIPDGLFLYKKDRIRIAQNIYEIIYRTKKNPY